MDSRTDAVDWRIPDAVIAEQGGSNKRDLDVVVELTFLKPQTEMIMLRGDY